MLTLPVLAPPVLTLPVLTLPVLTLPVLAPPVLTLAVPPMLEPLEFVLIPVPPSAVELLSDDAVPPLDGRALELGELTPPLPGSEVIAALELLDD